MSAMRGGGPSEQEGWRKGGKTAFEPMNRQENTSGAPAIGAGESAPHKSRAGSTKPARAVPCVALTEEWSQVSGMTSSIYMIRTVLIKKQA